MFVSIGVLKLGTALGLSIPNSSHAPSTYRSLFYVTYTRLKFAISCQHLDNITLTLFNTPIDLELCALNISI
jgi:hypothetical protein